ncbi:MAG: aminotransferase class I/II-fold pyridoxal phosphate-dependent enzyme [Candidatus Izemoplasmatales bacterium]|nr:aminotransferase class I/II-fold pyridoxal phosphate-dependent enzyme [Candidatus Izemoplasmatales bacterium]
MENRIVGKHALTKKMVSNILKTSQEAKAAKRLDPNVIDATVGMLNLETGNVCKYKTVADTLAQLTDAETYHYAPANGTAEFRNGIVDWVFGPHKEAILKTFHVNVIPTTGGSGAISNAMYNFNDFGQKILIPNNYWTPYENIAYEANLGVETFLMYDEQYNFNRKDFREKALALSEEQQRLFLVLNDPCNNPTGLCLTKADWVEVINVLNEIARKNYPVTILHDLAYLDYDMSGWENSRDIFETYLQMDERILAVIAFSGSKTFSLYGFRVGAQVGLSKSQEVIDDFIRVGDYSVRARFSSVNRPAMSAIGKIFTNEDKKQAFKAELMQARAILKKRVEFFKACAEKENLITMPYGGGFFIGIPTGNLNIYEDLVKDGVFVITMKGMIRIAISSVPLSEIERLVKIIKKHV